LSYSEFLELEPWEINLFAENLEDAEREEWERTRFSAYMTAQMNSTKKLKPEQIIKFKWDDEVKSTPTTKEQFEEYKKKMGIK
jgi:hypothetical protein